MRQVASSERRDVVRNRDAIIDAARAVFAEEGAGAALSHIAQRAGVGQATLYRHFPRRHDLMESLLDDNLRRLEACAEGVGDDPDGLFTVMRSICRMQLDTRSLFVGLTLTTEASRRRAVRARMAALLDEPLQAAIAGGRVREDVTVADLQRAIAMVGGHLERVADRAGRRKEAEAALDLVLNGITGRS